MGKHEFNGSILEYLKLIFWLALNSKCKDHPFLSKSMYYLFESALLRDKNKQIKQLIEANKLLNNANMLTADRWSQLLAQPEHALKIAYTIYLQSNLNMLKPLLDDYEPTCFESITLFFSSKRRFAYNRDQAINYKFKFLNDLTEYFIANKTSEASHKFEMCTDCSICWLSDADKAIRLGCGHVMHIECSDNCITSYVDQNKENLFNKCVVKGCNYRLTAAEMALVINKPETVFKVQKLLIRSIPGVEACPGCGKSLTKENDTTGFVAVCANCNKKSCYACGEEPHKLNRCGEQKRREEYVKFALNMVGTYQENYFGMCPKCEVLIYKNGGCYTMVCGSHASDWFSISNFLWPKGCNKVFDWYNRITLQQYLQKYAPKGSVPKAKMG